ncbi:MAG: phosphoribosylformylglycinamidine synthase I [Chloroflexi bacterium]|nr:phosphoribosylformylglycinamidine synthase I [Chloroflexota bacterium]
MTTKVAVILFPGTNCEDETLRAIRAAGLDARLVRWNEPLPKGSFGSYVLPGGWSYEDRVRAGAIAAHEDLVGSIRDEIARGKPILGICNGAQVLVESGLVPDGGAPTLALGPNLLGYRCVWTRVRLLVPSNRTVFTSRFAEGEIFAVPIAHGEGRFTSSDPGALQHLRDNKQLTFAYVDATGETTTEFPWNPNGSPLGAAGIANEEGTVLAFMPHPERASWWWQHAPHSRPPGWAARPDRLHLTAPAHRMFASLAQHLSRGRG